MNFRFSAVFKTDSGCKIEKVFTAVSLGDANAIAIHKEAAISRVEGIIYTLESLTQLTT